jgi:hypothetical protein
MDQAVVGGKRKREWWGEFWVSLDVLGLSGIVYISFLQR